MARTDEVAPWLGMLALPPQVAEDAGQGCHLVAWSATGSTPRGPLLPVHPEAAVADVPKDEGVPTSASVQPYL
jgi:hypothetical protein